MYITYSDCTIRYPILKKWHDENITMVNSDLIFYGEKELDGRLASHFTVPFSDTPSLIKDLAIDLVYLKSLISRDLEKATEFEKFFNSRIDRLKTGEEYLVTDSGTNIAPAASGTSIWSNTEDYHSVHSMLDAESEYTMISSEQLDAEENERD